jgi:hypothetical protein
MVQEKDIPNNGRWTAVFGDRVKYNEWRPNISINPANHSSGRSALAPFNNKLFFAMRGYGGDGTLWSINFDFNDGWSEGRSYPSGMGSGVGPAMAVANGKLFTFYADQHDNLWYTSSSDGTNWSPAKQVHLPGNGGATPITDSSVALATVTDSHTDRLNCVYRTPGGTLHFCDYIPQTDTWDGPTPVLNNRGYSPATLAGPGLTVLYDYLVCAYVRSDNRVACMQRAFDTPVWDAEAFIGTQLGTGEVALAYDSEADGVMCVFNELNTRQLYSSYLPEGGTRWTDPVPMSGCVSATGVGLAEIQYKNTLGYTAGYMFCTYNQP